MKPEEVYQQKKLYIEGVLSKMLQVYPGFESLEYVVDDQTSEEFVRLKEETSGPIFINVTGNSHTATLREVCRIVLDQRPTGLVTNAQAKKHIAPLFRKEAANV